MELMCERMKANQLPIYTMDLETDPFLRGRVPVPFVGGIFDGLTFRDYWTDHKSTCIEKLRHAFEDGVLETGIVYMHNGGRFDFFYLLDWFEGKATIIGSRIVRAFMPLKRKDGKEYSKNTKQFHPKFTRFDFRDSYAIMPFPLSAYMKDNLPLEYLTASNREEHREEIRSYLMGDCVYLWDLCAQFQKEFGDYKTIASASFAQLEGFHKYERLPVTQDAEIRSKFYFGGRVQCFQKGIIQARAKSSIAIYDVNSMYPFVMDTFFHPTGWIAMQDEKVHGWKDDGTFSRDTFKTFFLTVEGTNLEPAPFALRQKDGSVSYSAGFGQYHVTIHEFLTAMQLGLFKLSKILRSYSFAQYSRFHLFVDHFYRLREAAKKRDDKMHTLFYKYILNSAYGKFGLNPENYSNWEITKDAVQPKGKFWTLDSIVQDKWYVWRQPSSLTWNVKNICAAASITGAARSILFRAIATSRNVLYCDTDSILCEGFAGGTIDDKKLGAWKLEGQGTRAAIAGKKMYAVFDSEGTCIKHANKGVDLSPDEIVQAASGGSIVSMRDAPTFKRDGSALFISRTVRMT